MNNNIKNYDKLMESLRAAKQDRVEDLIKQGLIPEKAREWTGEDNYYCNDDKEYQRFVRIREMLYSVEWFLDRIQWQVGHIPQVTVTPISWEDLKLFGNKLLEVSKSYSLENCYLMSLFITRFPDNILITSTGRMFMHIRPDQVDQLESLHAELKDYWLTHPLCSTKVDRLRRLVATILDSRLYK